MNKFVSTAVMALLAIASVVLGSSSAQASDYSGVAFDIGISDRDGVVVSGQKFFLTANANVECNWTIKWNGQTRTATGKSIKAPYTAPTVTKPTVIKAHFVCQTVNSPRAGGTAVGFRAETFSDTLDVKVVPRAQAAAAPSASDLPSTGGPSLYLLGGGALLLIGGVGAVLLSRRDQVASH